MLLFCFLQLHCVGNNSLLLGYFSMVVEVFGGRVSALAPDRQLFFAGSAVLEGLQDA